MSYNPTQWSAGDTVTSAKLNKIEQGISNNGILEINLVFDEETGTQHLDKTWQEIYNANISIINLPSDEKDASYLPIRSIVISIGQDDEDYFVLATVGNTSVLFFAATPNDYPILRRSSGDDDTQTM